MTADQEQRTLLPIVAGGLTAATLDAAVAFFSVGWGMPRYIASGLLGASALHGGAGVWVLGLVLHYCILLVAAAIYGFSSWKLPFLRVNFVVCGVFYGIAIYLVMHLIVLPLSAFPLPVGPFKVFTLIRDITTHMVVVGLPIALSFRLLSVPRSGFAVRNHEDSNALPQS